MNIKDIKKLQVKYNGRLVGYLAELKSHKIVFQYDEEWINDGFPISPISLPLSSKIYDQGKEIFNGLYGVFWDSLPDGWGELLIKRMLAKKGINYDNLSPIQKLSLVAKNGLGGLEYEPYTEIKTTSTKYDLDDLAKETSKILNDELYDSNLDSVFALGGSSGGASPKAHITVDSEEWIVKFPCRIDPINIGEKEYLMNQMAFKCGINVNEYKLFDSNVCKGYFGAKRFDRVNGRKIHTISLAGVLETTHRIPNLDYGHLFEVIKTICVDQSDMYEAFRRMCFNVIFGNKDDHSKNFSFIYDEEEKGYKLSPAYDLTSTPNKFEHEMTVNRNGNPTKEDIFALANINKLSTTKCEKIFNSIYDLYNQ